MGGMLLTMEEAIRMELPMNDDLLTIEKVTFETEYGFDLWVHCSNKGEPHRIYQIPFSKIRAHLIEDFVVNDNWIPNRPENFGATTKEGRGVRCMFTLEVLLNSWWERLEHMKMGMF